jgi:hypothetical protein
VKEYLWERFENRNDQQRMGNRAANKWLKAPDQNDDQ